MKSLSTDTRNSIVQMTSNGVSSRKIAAQLNISHTSVNRIRKQVIPDVPKPASGRPAKLTATDKRGLVRMITSGKADNAVQITRELKNGTNIEVGTSTVRRVLKEAGLTAVVKQKKPRLLPRHIRQRLDFALRHQHWTVEDWKRVIWSDETKINRLGSDGRDYVWKKPGSAITEQHIKGTVKFGGGSLMLWGCMTAQGVGYAARIDGRMDAQLYAEILDDDFIKTLGDYELGVDEIIFQQDNDPKHTSRIARKWFEDNGVEVLEWPAQSPDLNPIEHLWQHLKRQLATYETEPASIYELWKRVEVEWYNIPVQVCIGLIESMPRRVTAVLEAKGGYTKY
jgi:transposase